MSKSRILLNPSISRPGPATGPRAAAPGVRPGCRRAGALAAFAALALGGLACSGAGQAQGAGKSTPAAASPAPAQKPLEESAAADAGVTAQSSGGKEAGAPPAPSHEAPLPPGAIRRAEVNSYLQNGPHYLISRVRVKAAFRGGKFFGWRVLSYRGPGPIKQGDIIVSVNEQSIERPEQFMDVWSAAGKKDALVVRLMRAGLVHELRYAIVD